MKDCNVRFLGHWNLFFTENKQTNKLFDVFLWHCQTFKRMVEFLLNSEQKENSQQLTICKLVIETTKIYYSKSHLLKKEETTSFIITYM